jgi:hypothetical protein
VWAVCDAGNAQQLIEKWSGSSWSIAATPNPCSG